MYANKFSFFIIFQLKRTLTNRVHWLEWRVNRCITGWRGFLNSLVICTLSHSNTHILVKETERMLFLQLHYDLSFSFIYGTFFVPVTHFFLVWCSSISLFSCHSVCSLSLSAFCIFGVEFFIFLVQ